MPRRGPAKAIAAEDLLAARIKYERETRIPPMSPAGLAARMTQAGCPMTQSAIWKIENGEPRRRITFDEAVAFAQVFDLSLEDLLIPAEVAASKEATRLWADIERAQEHYLTARDELYRIEARLLDLVDSAASQSVLGALKAEHGEDPEEYIRAARLLQEGQLRIKRDAEERANREQHPEEA